MRKPSLGICENKGANQMRGIHTADQRAYIVQSLNFQNLKFQASTIFCGCTAQFVSEQVRNLEYRICCNVAHPIFQALLLSMSVCAFHAFFFSLKKIDTNLNVKCCSS